MRIGYARVSTLDQNPQLQLDALAAARCERVFSETASGKGMERPELKAALSALRSGDVLVVWRLDRLGRSLRDLVHIVAALKAEGVGLLSLTEAIDTTTAGGQLMFHIIGALAEFERNMIRERTLAGLAAGRARGRNGGRRAKLDRSDVLKAVAMLRDPNITKTETARHFKVTRMTLDRALERFGFPLNPAAEPLREAARTADLLPAKLSEIQA